MEIMLLTIALLYFVWSIAVLVFDADIWLRNKLRIEKPRLSLRKVRLFLLMISSSDTLIQSHRKKPKRNLCKLSRRTRVKR